MDVSRWISCCIISLMSVYAFGQLEVKVVNEDQEGLAFVEVYTSDFEFSTYSNEEGMVTIPEKLKKDQVIIFNFLGYQQASFTKEELFDHPIITLKQGLILEEVVMVGRTDNQSRDLPGKVESINTKIFQLTNPQTAADALGQHADVYIQRSQMGGGSPVVRGFEANKSVVGFGRCTHE